MSIVWWEHKLDEARGVSEEQIIGTKRYKEFDKGL